MKFLALFAVVVPFLVLAACGSSPATGLFGGGGTGSSGAGSGSPGGAGGKGGEAGSGGANGGAGDSDAGVDAAEQDADAAPCVASCNIALAGGAAQGVCAGAPTADYNSLLSCGCGFNGGGAVCAAVCADNFCAGNITDSDCVACLADNCGPVYVTCKSDGCAAEGDSCGDDADCCSGLTCDSTNTCS